MSDDKQELLRDFLDENKISIYDVVNCGYWRQRGFLENIFRYLGTNVILSEAEEYFKINNYKFKELEETVTQNKYVVISKSDYDYYCVGFQSMICMKSWLSELNLLVPICLIVDGNISKNKFSKMIKYDIESEEEE